MRFFPIRGTPAETLIAEHPPAHQADPRRRRRPAAGRHRPVLDPRSGGGRRIRPAPARTAPQVRRHARDRHARVLREAAHHGRLEGAHQRPLPRPELPHRRGPAHGAAAARRAEPARHAGRQRVPRRDLAAVHRRPHQLGRDRRAHHREPGAPRARLGPVGADRLQERHRRQHPHRHRRHPGGGTSAPLPVGAQERPGGDRRDARQSRLPRHPARRQGAELRRRAASKQRCRRAALVRRAVERDGRLLACQQQQAAPEAARRGARHRRRSSPAAAATSSA